MEQDIEPGNNRMSEEKQRITPEEVLYVAKLARLHLLPDEVGDFARQLGEILSYVEKLNNADTGDVPAASHVLPICNALREDEARPSIDRESALANAPMQDGTNFLVPRVI